jgi:hypothetical protein
MWRRLDEPGDDARWVANEKIGLDSGVSLMLADLRRSLATVL